MVSLSVNTIDETSLTTFDDDSKLYLQYFRVEEAIAAVAAHVEALPSSRTPERHTQRVYEAGLKYFLEWSDMQLPTENLMQGFIAHLIKHRGLKASTIGSKYLAPVRLYLRKLGRQAIVVRGSERDFVADCRLHITNAADVKTPRPETTTNLSPLWSKGKRLNIQQVNSVLRQIDRKTKSGARDYALLMVAFSTGLRVAELKRIRLNKIRREGEDFILTVRGKRSNVDPVKLDVGVYQAIRDYMNLHNAGLEDDDPRWIHVDSPLWQSYIHGDNYGIVGVNGHDPDKGMSIQAIRDVIARRTRVLGDDYALAAHDTRRTTAAIAYMNGAPINAIQKILRHKNPSVTLNYIGEPPEMKTLTDYVSLG